MKSKQKVLHPYNTSFYSRWPKGLKISIAKWWFAASTYYFIGFGMPNIMQSSIDVIFNLGLVLGALSALILYPLINYITKVEGDGVLYKAVKTQSPLRIIYLVMYNWLMVTIIAYSYQLINFVINSVMHFEKGTIKFGVEPILFGIFYMMFDRFVIKVISRNHKSNLTLGSTHI